MWIKIICIENLLNSCLGKWYMLPYLVVPLISARVPQISTRVSAHCQAILLHPLSSVGWNYLSIPKHQRCNRRCLGIHDDVIKWKHFPRYWPFVRGIHRLPVNSPHKGQWQGALMFSLICAWINGWVNNREAGDLRRHRVHYVAIVMVKGPLIVQTRSAMHVHGLHRL